MPALSGSKTMENLKEAFAGESQANRRYLYFAQKADVEGFNDVAAVFRSTAEGETGHALHAVKRIVVFDMGALHIEARQADEPRRPDGDCGDMYEFEQGNHQRGALLSKLRPEKTLRSLSRAAAR